MAKISECLRCIGSYSIDGFVHDRCCPNNINNQVKITRSDFGTGPTIVPEMSLPVVGGVDVRGDCRILRVDEQGNAFATLIEESIQAVAERVVKLLKEEK